MVMKRVLLGQEIHPQARQLLDNAVEVLLAPDPSEPTIRSMIGQADAVIVRTASRITAATIEAAAKLQVIARTGAGVDNVDVQAATARGIPVCYTPEANCSSVVEHALAVILALAKNLPAMDRAVRQSRFAVRHQYQSSDVAGKVLGVVGFGRIGRELVRRAVGLLDMTAVIFDPYLNAEQTPSEIRRAWRLQEVFEQADFVTLHAPYSKETHHLVNADLIGRMKRTSYLINTSRGAVVDEAALVRALRAGAIAGAALDVFEEEPPEPTNPLLTLDNVILTPHTAALTKECAARMAVGAVEGVLAVLAGKRPKHVFNPEIYHS